MIENAAGIANGKSTAGLTVLSANHFSLVSIVDGGKATALAAAAAAAAAAAFPTCGAGAVGAGVCAGVVGAGVCAIRFTEREIDRLTRVSESDIGFIKIVLMLAHPSIITFVG